MVLLLCNYDAESSLREERTQKILVLSHDVSALSHAILTTVLAYNQCIAPYIHKDAPLQGMPVCTHIQVYVQRLCISQFQFCIQILYVLCSVRVFGCVTLS